MRSPRQIIRQIVHRLALSCGMRLSRARPFECAIRRFELCHDEFHFLQIGAHNGVTSDPFQRFIVEGSWNCVLVEPQRRFYDILQTIYCDRSNIRCSNTAIGDVDGTASMYLVRDDAEGLPYWASQLASFRYETIASHEDRIPNIRDLIVRQDVKCRTLNSLVQEHQLSCVNLLAIDVEGYDFEVLKQIDSLSFRPNFIYFEHGHLSSEEHRTSLEFLADRGYRTHSVNEGDTFAEYKGSR